MIKASLHDVPWWSMSLYMSLFTLTLFAKSTANTLVVIYPVLVPARSSFVHRPTFPYVDRGLISWCMGNTCIFTSKSEFQVLLSLSPYRDENHQVGGTKHELNLSPRSSTVFSSFDTI